MVMAVATIPFELNAQGVAHVGGTRVTLDSVILTFLDGATAEEIVQRYPTLKLADVYSTIAYYLHNRQEIDDYLRKSAAATKNIRQQNETRFLPDGVRERLLKRKRTE